MPRTKETNTKKRQIQERQRPEYKRMARSGAPWTEQEDAAILEHYPDMGPTAMMDLLPGRSSNSISVRAKMMGVTFGNHQRKEYKVGTPEEERDIILGEIEFLIHSICDEEQKKRQALGLLVYAAKRNSSEWWFMRRGKKLGHWCEMFIKGYEYTAKSFARDDFLEGDGVFVDKGGSDYAFYGRNGR